MSIPLRPRQLAILRDLAAPTRGGGPFPARNSIIPLIRMGLVETFDDPNDIFAKMVNAWALRATPAGIRAAETGSAPAVLPIVFSAPMVTALFTGRKTMTRRLARSPLARTGDGDVLWVKETYAPRLRDDGKRDPNRGYVKYRADGVHGKTPVNDMDWHTWPERWSSSMMMPRWASRLTLKVTAAKTEALLSISDEDAIAEGIQRGVDGWWGWGEHPEERDEAPTPAEAYLLLWEHIHGKASVESDPDVVAISFTVHPANVDDVLKEAA